MYDYTDADIDPNADTCADSLCNDKAPAEIRCAGKCRQRFCRGCLSKIGDELYCFDCATCEVDGCGEGAIVACHECGNLVCGDHVRKHPTKTECRQCNPRPDHGAKAA